MTPSLPHLLFVDDSLFFFKADDRESTIVKYIMGTYEITFEQAANFQKSDIFFRMTDIFFSSNTSHSLKNIVCNILEVSTPLDHGEYLGLPSLIGWSKKQVFSFLKDRL